MVYCSVYSSGMKRLALLTLLLGLCSIEMGLFFMDDGTAIKPGMGWPVGFFIGLPLTLAILVWFQFRWAAMVCVMYATVGLAMDIATLVQVLKNDAEVPVTLLHNAISGVFNFLLIVFGGRSFLDVSEAMMPQESRPPSPPSPS